MIVLRQSLVHFLLLGICVFYGSNANSVPESHPFWIDHQKVSESVQYRFQAEIPEGVLFFNMGARLGRSF